MDGSKTKEVFGEPLSPAETVKCVMKDVKEKGDEAWSIIQRSLRV
jgi:hypothetical protein